LQTNRPEKNIEEDYEMIETDLQKLKELKINLNDILEQNE